MKSTWKHVEEFANGFDGDLPENMSNLQEVTCSVWNKKIAKTLSKISALSSCYEL